ncbi:MAG TPA: ABC transporter ATP-binding protein [Gemmatimonadaceae bacterium]|nr:ABC transporter ATP-binding protein [Gemmatimonadaceae bacterium]
MTIPMGMAGGRMTIPDEERPRGLRERLSALRYLPSLVRLVWQTHRGFTSAMVVLRLLRAFVPIASLWAAKLIIDQVVQLTRAPGGSLTQLWRVVALELAIVVVGELLARASSLVESLLGDLFSNHISVRLMRHAATLDLAQFEDPDFYDHLERARRQTTARIGLIAMLLAMGQDLLTLVTLAAALVAHNPWLLLLLTLAILPSFLGETHFAALSYSLLFSRTPERRELDYLRYVGASDKTAKEVQMFGLAGWLADRYAALAQRYYEENRRLSIRKGFFSALLSLVGTMGYYGAYVTILLRAVAGTITLGTLTFLAAAFGRSRDLIQRLLLSASDIYEQSLYLRDLFVFFEMRPAIASKPGAARVPKPIRTGFVFEDVGFQYPGSDRWAIRHVNLEISPGERIALVGENGAGKTTITKLLARLYEPTEGRILLDGVDLREYDLTSLREAIGVIFQDFVRYDMRFDENVGVGEINEVTGYLAEVRDDPEHTGVAPPTALVDASERSLAATLLPRFSDGYRQMLGRRFENGVDLSGGEWQKIALARAYMREAQLLILDEPTAALDARAEYEVFVRFNQLMAGRMAVVISHRFSTVRMADRIVVLGDGRVLEEGTHESLLTRAGLYAELFEMQAAGYR